MSRSPIARARAPCTFSSTAPVSRLLERASGARASMAPPGPDHGARSIWASTRTRYAEELARTWHDDMIWWGPAGIGASYTIPRYIRQHAGPFRQPLNDGRRFNGHICRLAEGHFGGFFGWANLTLRNSGGYMGMT